MKKARSKTKRQNYSEQRKFNYWPYILVAGVVLTLAAISPYLFASFSWGYAEFGDDTGPIGDTIGGITAPFMNLVGAILVFAALRAQLTPELIATIKNRMKAFRSSSEMEKSVQENFDSNVSLSVQPRRRFFMKFMGTSKDRGVLTDSIAQYISAANCDKWIAHAKRPNGIQQVDVIYFARMMKGGDYRFYGRGRAIQFNSEIDTDVLLGHWPYKNRIIGAEFIEGTFNKGISFDEILASMNPTQNMFFEATKQKHLNGIHINNFCDVLKRAGYREISMEAASIIDRGFTQLE